MAYIGAEPIVSATRTITEVTATAGQTVFTANGGYTVGYIDVFLNGAQLQTVDFTATNGTTITLTEAAQVGDVIRLVAWGTFLTSNGVAKTGDTMTGNLQINVGGVSYTTYDANGYPRFTQSGGSAQLGLFRAGNNVGGGYIGGDATNCFDVRDASFTSRLLVDQSGRVRMPYQPAFSARRDAGHVGGSSGNSVIVVFDNVLLNTGSNYNNSNGRFTAPVAGTYYFSSLGMQTGSGSLADAQLRLNKNGSSVAISNPPMGSSTNLGMGFAVSAIIQLNVGDYVQVEWYNSSTWTLYANGGPWNNFSGFLLG